MYSKKTSSNHLTSIQDRLSGMNLIKGIRNSNSKKINKSFYIFRDYSPGSLFFSLIQKGKKGGYVQMYYLHISSIFYFFFVA